MANTFGQGAPGVRIKLRDRSETNLVLNPNIVGGIVGHSSRGEFNTVIDLTSVSNIDTILGRGFNNPKYNQGLYAARSIITAGGFVEYVRPYGEEIITDDNDDDYETNQKLKTDTFLVEYDYSGTASTSSMDISHFAATRHIEDAFVTLGEREIHTIQKTITENTNVNFLLDSIKTDTKKIPLFAIMNTDPTSSQRAGDSVEISTIDGDATTITVTTSELHGFNVGDTVTVGGTVNYNGTFVIATVPTTTTFTISDTLHNFAAESVGSVFINVDDVNSGVDALTVRTVTSGYSTKNFEFLDFEFASDGDVVVVKKPDGTSLSFEFDDDDDLNDDNNYSVGIEFDEFKGVNISTGDETLATDSGVFVVGDIVRFVTGTGGGATLPAGVLAATDYVVATSIDGLLTFIDSTGTPVDFTTTGTDGTTTDHRIVNITKTTKNFMDVMVANGFKTNTRATFKGTDVDPITDLITVDNAALFSVGDEVIFSLSTNAVNGVDVALPTGLVDYTVYTVSAVDLSTSTIKLTGVDITLATTADDSYRITNLTTAKGSSVALSNGHKVDFVGVLGLQIPDDGKDDATPANSFFDITSAPDVTKGTVDLGTVFYIIETSETGIVLDSSAGRTFLNLGLSEEDYIDIDFDGVKDKVYKLNAEGIEAAKIYLFVDYFFNGETFSFSGTIIPFVSGDTNFYIAESAATVELGWKFVINENADLEGSVSETGFNFSQSVDENDLIQSSFSGVSFNDEDPAILNDAIWEYDPSKNNTTAILSSAWNLFLNKDKAASDMLVSAGTAISNLFVRGFEQVNYTVMATMLTICEKRKDMFAIFDGVDEKRIDIALQKMVGIGGQGENGRWGAIFDGRSIFPDTAYTKISVEAVKSIELATIITLNRSGNAFWLPPAGHDTGTIPPANASRQKFERSYNFSEDPNSDIARLYDANINPTRVNNQGQIIYGQKTMLRRSTALNRLNVIMLVAGIHKRFCSYLELKVFRLNTPQLRATIVADLQPQLDAIATGINAGLTTGVVFCNEKNNPQIIIDTNQLIVDVVIQPTRTTEFITLRTTVQRTGEDVNSVDITIIGG